jgi:hypothetical protein
MATVEKDATYPWASPSPQCLPTDRMQVAPGVPAQRNLYQEAIREALREEMLRDPVSSCWARTSASTAARLASPYPVRSVRTGAGAQYPDLREHDRRRSRRRGPGRHATRCRDHVRGLLRPGHGPDRQSGCQAALHDRRPVQGADGGAYAPGRRRRQEHSRPALAEP